MIKTNKAGAVATLQDLLTTLPADQDARSEFFLSWKNRVLQSLELIFQDDPQPSQQFKEIEFSPRRLSNNETRDDQLRLDAYLAGCAAARTLLESFLWRLSSADQAPADASAPILTVSRVAETKAAAAPATAKPAPKPRPQPAAPAGPSTAPWVMQHPDYAPDPPAPSKPLMAPDTVVLPPSPGQVEATERKLALERAAREKAAHEKAERERLEREKAERERAEQERVQKEKAEHERIERENSKRQKAERERERAENEKAERERAHREKAEREKAERDAERAERHRERAEREREKAEKAARAKPERPKPHREPAESPVIADASMDADELCSPVRGSLARMLSAWESGDRDTAAVVSAQLLADLSMLAHHDRFKAAFEHVVTRAFAPDVARKTLDALKTAGPLCVWSMIAAMNEVMKN